MKTSKFLSLLVGITSLAVLMGACALPVLSTPQKQTPNAPTQAAPSQAAPSEAAPTQAADDTAQPQSTQQPPAPTQPAANHFNYEGVSLAIDASLASGASGQVVPEKQGSTDGPYWDANPRYPSITLNGYPISDSAFQPIIAVYPVEDFRKLSPPAGQIIDQLQALLEKKPADQDKIPLLPVWNAAQVFHSNLQYVNFQNGSGVRFLTLYAQYPAPINNKDIFYTFQGLTSDGRYYVSIILPIHHASLPASAEVVSQSEMEAHAKDSTYYPNMAKDLTAQPASSFSPDMAKLDALVTSLSIEK